MNKLFITNEQADQIYKLYRSSPDYGNFSTITDWSIEKHDVEFNGSYPNYYLKASPEQIAWFILKLW